MKAPLSAFDMSSLHAAGAEAEPALSEPAGGEDCGAGAWVAPHAATFKANKTIIRFITEPPSTSWVETIAAATAPDTATGATFDPWNLDSIRVKSPSSSCHCRAQHGRGACD